MVKILRISWVNSSNINVIEELKLKLAKFNIDDSQQKPNNPTSKHTRHRGEKAEAIYASPVPRIQRGPLSAEENLQQWGNRRSLPIDTIRITVAELKQWHPQQQKYSSKWAYIRQTESSNSKSNQRQQHQQQQRYQTQPAAAAAVDATFTSVAASNSQQKKNPTEPQLTNYVTM